MHKALKFVGWAVLALVGLVIVAYGAMLAINWRDRLPSESAVRFAEFQRDRPAVPVEENGAIFALGFGASPDADVAAIGKARDEWLRAQNEADVFDPKRDPLREPYESDGVRSQRVKAFIASCGPNTGPCTNTFVDALTVYADWIAAEPWLLSRYETLLAHPGWMETVPVHVAAPLASFGRVMDGQKLLLLKAKVLADQGELAEAHRLLESDFRFWRRVLPAADILISKMIAAVAINRNLEFGNLILRDLPPAAAARVTPSQWLVAFNDEERSMQRALIGEWVFSSGILRSLADGWQEEHPALHQRLSSSLAAPFYKIQDTLNQSADRHSTLIALFEVPITRYPQAIDRSEQLARPPPKAMPVKLYNPIGNWIIGQGSANVTAYAARVSDLEGTRRATLAAIDARARQVSADAMPEFLDRSEQRNPYDGQPFGWDREEKEIVFRGLEKGTRGEHRVWY